MSWRFDDETALAPTQNPGVWHTHLSNRWNIGDNPNGGYAASALLRALLASVPHPMPLSVTTHYLRPAIADAQARLETEVIRSGRTTSTATGRLIQDDKERVRLLASFGAFADAVPEQEAISLTMSPFAMPGPNECVSRSTLEQGIDLPILSRLDVRIPPVLAEPGGSVEALTGGWIRFVDGRPPDAHSLVLFCDAFPPSPFGLVERLGWVPTLELTVHVRRPPADGWIRARFESRDVHEGLLVEDGVLWDSTGVVVAQCRQLALLRTGQ